MESNRFNQNRRPVMAVPPPVDKHRNRGRYRLCFLQEGQEFRTLITGRLGYIVDKDTHAVKVILEPEEREKILHPSVVVEAF